jgi:peptidoglycan/LPS O-acetylase OafA/YrhL
VLASIVVFAHIDTGFSAGSANPVVSWMWSFGGNQAVICFFVISGFSIGASVERRHEHFYERRFWRIYPVYLTCFALACVPFAIFGPAIASRNGMGDTELPLGRWWAASFLLNAIALPNIITPALATFSQA